MKGSKYTSFARQWCLALILIWCSSIVSCVDASAVKRQDREKASWNQTEKERYVRYLEGELKETCEYCEEKDKELFQRSSITDLEVLDTKDSQATGGTLRILKAHLHSCGKEESQTFAVFEDERGEFLGFGFEQVPFLE